MRKAFSFYRSHYEQMKLLNKTQVADITMAICEVQFLEVHINDIKFKDKMTQLVWTGIKHAVDASVVGYGYAKKDILIPLEGGSEILQPPIEEEQGEEEVQVQVQEEVQYSMYVDLWNNLAKSSTLSPVKTLSKARKAKILKRENESPDFMGLFNSILQEIRESDFLNGLNEQTWKVSFDWIFHNDSNYLKILEGNYKNKIAPINKHKNSSTNYVNSYFEKQNKQEEEIIYAELN